MGETMKTRDKVALGLLAGAGALWGARVLLRGRRRITLDDRVVIITGGTSGHGLLVARYAAEQGARIVLAARKPEELRAAEHDLLTAGARDVLAVPTDITDEAQVRALVARALDRFGRIDILVNNAGTILVGPMEAMTLEDYRRVLATNFWGALYCTLAVLPAMRAQGMGRIANVDSIGGLVAAPHLLPYTISKFALTGLTKGLRAELAKDNIFVTGIYPGTMRTGGHTHAWFKGDHQAEYTWFGISDTAPLASISAERVARTLWRAILDGDPQVIIGWHARAAAALEQLAPNWSAEFLALMNQLLPPPTNLDAPAIQGQDLQGKIAGMLNRAVPGSTRP